MKVLVFAHVPPPLHGQSYMVQLMLENLGNRVSDPNERLELFHVNAQLSDGLDDIGTWRIGKFFHLAGFILQAWWMKWKYSIDAFYYVPAPPAKRGALYRDWLVLFVVAPLFKIKIFHWHAVGLGQSIREAASSGILRRLEAGITRRLLSGHDLSCVLNEWGRRDVEIFSPRNVAIVANGIPDPCPDSAAEIVAQRHERARQRVLGRETSPALFQLLYLAHATRSKGLFDTVEAVARANAQLSQKESGWRIRLTVAGAFLQRNEEDAFHARISREDLRLKSSGKESSAVVYAGHVGAVEKERLLRESDALCFASFYPYEGQPVAIIEAMAFGMPVLASRWRALPEMLSPSLAHLVEPGNPDALAEALIELAGESRFGEYRKYFLDHYSLAAHIQHLRAAFLVVAPASS
jgi:glycosyltransferase involved in cell wall biosynthesis